MASFLASQALVLHIIWLLCYTACRRFGYNEEETQLQSCTELFPELLEFAGGRRRIHGAIRFFTRVLIYAGIVIIFSENALSVTMSLSRNTVFDVGNTP